MSSSTLKDCHGNNVPPSALREYKIAAPGIEATLIPYGARLVSLRVNPPGSGGWTEVAVGYGTPAAYAREAAPSYYGAVIGRVGNRIRGGRFTVAGTEYSVTANEHGGQNTLHGGRVGYDAREWAVLSATETSVTFQLRDDAFEGFPGSVLVTAQYAVKDCALHVALSAVPLDAPTPIALTTHGYYNLGGSGPVADDTLVMPKASRFVRGDGILVPTGEVPSVSGGPLDFTRPKHVADGLASRECGAGAHGIDNCFVFDSVSDQPQLEWTSAKIGLRLRLSTDQPAVQIYACAPSKESTIGKTGADAGCLAVEPQAWIDAVNHPEWGQKAVYEPGEVYVNTAVWAFDYAGKDRA